MTGETEMFRLLVEYGDLAVKADAHHTKNQKTIDEYTEMVARMNEIFLMGQSRPLRSVQRGEGWTPQSEDARDDGDIDYARVIHSASFRRLQGKSLDQHLHVLGCAKGSRVQHNYGGLGHAHGSPHTITVAEFRLTLATPQRRVLQPGARYPALGEQVDHPR